MFDLSKIPVLTNASGDLEERSYSSDPKDWPIYSYSQSQTWDRCEFDWYIAYRLGYTLIRQQKGFDVGTLLHDGAEVLYSNDCSFEALDTWMKDYITTADMDSIEEIRRAFYVLNIYAKEFVPMNDQGLNPIEAELHLHAPFKTKTGRNYWIQCYIDVLMEHHKKQVAIWDHKSHSANPWKERQFQMDPQTPIYCGVTRENGIYFPNLTVLNMLNTYPYKDMKSQSHDKLFQRIELVRSDVEISNAINQFSRLVDDNIDRYKNPRKSLNRACGDCQFQQVCFRHQKGFPIEPVLGSSLYKKKPVKVDVNAVDT